MDTYNFIASPSGGQDIPYIHRDISWLSFNERVLQEAQDPNVPLLERLKFLAIYSSNLDEFFRVRVANHRNLVRLNKRTKKELEFDPKKLLRDILKIVNKQQELYSEVFSAQIIPELAKEGIFLKRRLELSKSQLKFVADYFHSHLLPYVQPVLLVRDKIRPFLNNGTLYMVNELVDRVTRETAYALIKLPSQEVGRFVELPGDATRHEIIMIDDIIRQSVSWMFPGYEIIDTYSIKLTRDAELYIDDEFSGDLVDKIKTSLSKRHVGPASRFVYDREMPSKLLSYLRDTFELGRYDLLREGRYHNNSDFFAFPDFGRKDLLYPVRPAIAHHILETSTDFWEAIHESDHLLYYPYHSYNPVVRFFEEASTDPDVTHIKIVQYRVAKKSRIMDAIRLAVERGKQVSAFIEIKARFDEEANLRWGEMLQEAGVTVHYSFPGVKVHAKLAIVRRLENGKPRLYSYLSTGNFHETTAKVYTDFGFFTADRRVTTETARLFTFLETVRVPRTEFKHLLVGQFNLRGGFVDRIDREIATAKSGGDGRIFVKMNSLQDTRMIEKLYEASQAGVKIRIIVRGICSLVPGLEGFSENIEAISIVDRYLEHSRVFIFHNGGDPEVYLSSADWMTRNLSYRIETAVPIYNEKVKREIIELNELQWTDNVKARVLDAELTNSYRTPNADIQIRSQLESYHYIRRLEQAAVRADVDAEAEAV